MKRILTVVFGLVMIVGGIVFFGNPDPTIYFHILGFGITTSILAVQAITLGIYTLFVFIKEEFVDPFKREKEKQQEKLHRNSPIL